MGEREPVRSYLQELFEARRLLEKRRQDIRAQNSQLIEKGLRIFGRCITLLADPGIRATTNKPAVLVETGEYGAILLSLSHRPDGVTINMAQNGTEEEIFRILHFGGIENPKGQQVSSGELETVENIVGLLESTTHGDSPVNLV